MYIKRSVLFYYLKVNFECQCQLVMTRTSVLILSCPNDHSGPASSTVKWGLWEISGCISCFLSTVQSFSLDKVSGKKCYMLSARDLIIVWGDNPTYWRWTSEHNSRFVNLKFLALHSHDTRYFGNEIRLYKT